MLGIPHGYASSVIQGPLETFLACLNAPDIWLPCPVRQLDCNISINNSQRRSPIVCLLWERQPFLPLCTALITVLNETRELRPSWHQHSLEYWQDFI